MTQFNVGTLTRELQSYFFTRPDMRPVQYVVDDPASIFNFATPANLLVALDDLANLTDAVEEQMLAEELGIEPGGIAGPQEVETPHELRPAFEDWKIRLAEYIELANAAPSQDRLAVFESVTMPLLIGLYPGDPVQKPLDAMTPYIIANGLKVAVEWRKRRLELFFEELANRGGAVFQGAATAAENIGKFLTGGGILWAIGIGFGVIAAYYLFKD